MEVLLPVTHIPSGVSQSPTAQGFNVLWQQPVILLFLEYFMLIDISCDNKNQQLLGWTNQHTSQHKITGNNVCFAYMDAGASIFKI